MRGPAPAARLGMTSRGAPLRSSGPPITEKFAFFNDLDDFRRDHALPCAVAAADFGHRFSRINPQIFRIVVSDLLDVAIVDQILKKRAQVRRDVDLRDRKSTRLNSSHE